MFLIFENQHSIKFSQKRNYRNTAFFYSSYVNQSNWIFWAKHSALNPNSLHDAVGYCHNINIFNITQNLINRGVITAYNISWLKHSQNTLLLTTPETKKDAIAAVYPSALFYEREVQEMFGLRLRHLRDSRALLLDYLTTSSPLIKEQPVWGVEEVSYTKQTDRLCFIKNNIFTI